jgi:hypothetical protein
MLGFASASIDRSEFDAVVSQKYCLSVAVLVITYEYGDRVLGGLGHLVDEGFDYRLGRHEYISTP